MPRPIKLIVALAAFASLSAQASITTQSSWAAYNAATTGNTTVDFEAQGNGGAAYYANSLAVGGVNFGDAASRLFVLAGGYYGEGFASHYLNENDYTTNMTVTFTGPIYGFAMDAVLLNFSSGANLTVVFNFASGTESVTLPNAFAGGTPTFVGFTSDSAFSSITMTNGSGGLAMDNFTYARAANVPEPGSMALAGLALLGLAAARRRG